MTLTAPTTGIVTVTYGRRWSLLRQRLAAAQDEGATHAWVVDNGAQDDITMLARDEFGAFVTVVSLPRNCGSAGGFKAGLAAASTGSCDFILILDDDNCPELRSGHPA
jgi:GT2 family glycosyltransferase